MTKLTHKAMVALCAISLGVSLSAICCVVYLGSIVIEIRRRDHYDEGIESRLTAVENLACDLKEDHTWMLVTPCSKGCKEKGFRKLPSKD